MSAQRQPDIPPVQTRQRLYSRGRPPASYLPPGRSQGSSRAGNIRRRPVGARPASLRHWLADSGSSPGDLSCTYPQRVCEAQPPNDVGHHEDPPGSSTSDVQPVTVIPGLMTILRFTELLL